MNNDRPEIEVGNWRTRGGRKATILCTYAPGDFPVIGYVHHESPNTITAMMMDGEWEVVLKREWMLVGPSK